MGKTIPEYIKNEMREAYLSGEMTTVDLYKKYGVSRYTLYCSILKPEDVNRRKNITVPVEEKQHWWNDYQNGMLVSQISRKYGRSEGIICNYFRKHREFLKKVEEESAKTEEAVKANIRCKVNKKLYPPLLYCKKTKKWYYDITYAPTEDGLNGYFGYEFGSKKPHHNWSERQEIINE